VPKKKKKNKKEKRGPMTDLQLGVVVPAHPPNASRYPSRLIVVTLSLMTDHEMAMSSQSLTTPAGHTTGQEGHEVQDSKGHNKSPILYIPYM